MRLCQEWKQLRANFSSCNLVQQNIRPKEAFVIETAELLLNTYVSYGSTVFIGLKVVDDEGHHSELSNIVSVYFVEPIKEDGDGGGGVWNSTHIILASVGAVLLLTIIICVLTCRCEVKCCICIGKITVVNPLWGGTQNKYSESEA